MRRRWISLMTLCVAALAGRAAWALIDPHFTPVHLVRQSDCILVGSLRTTPDASVWHWRTTRVLKGQGAPQRFVVGLAQCKKAQFALVRSTLAQNRQGRALLYSASGPKDAKAFLHLGGQWLSLKQRGGGGWDVVGFAQRMTAVYAGGTDMLVRMTRYVLAHPDATVPASVGTGWASRAKIGTVARPVTGMAVVGWQGDRGPCLFVASSQGDRLFRAEPDGERFVEVTQKAKLRTCSRRFVWLDVSRDGLADLVTWDGAAVAIRLASSDGALAADNPRRTLRGDGACLGLSAISTRPDGAPAVLVSTDDVPFVLDARERRRALPAGRALREAGRLASACIVADLDNDGFPDVLQPRDRGGALWRGSAGGSHQPVPSPVCSPGGPARFALGDFDGDGFLDLFLSGRAGNQLWENNGKGGFRPVIHSAGSLSYKTPPGASECLAGDLNHDGRPDLGLGYADGGFIYHFNRGYRCFGEEGGLRLVGAGLTDGPVDVGVVACAADDFNADGGLDLAVALPDGSLYCYYNQLCDTPAVMVRLRKGMAGPVTVSAWQGTKSAFCAGAYAVRGHAPATWFPLRRPGACTLRYRLPGGPVRSLRVEVGDQIREVVLGEADHRGDASPPPRR